MQHGDLEKKFLFSLDVVSLYSSVNTDEAIDTLRSYLKKEKNNIHLIPIFSAKFLRNFAVL